MLIRVRVQATIKDELIQVRIQATIKDELSLSY